MANSSLSEIVESALHSEDRKEYTRGTHRIVSPAHTVSAMRPLLGSLGITRIANVTGLDVIGIPVCMVIRPNSRSLAVSQGKGVTLDAARASGLMESVELYHAEHIDLPLRLSTLRQLRSRERVIDTDALARTSQTRFNPDVPTLWIQGYDLGEKGDVWLPFEAVSTDYTLPAYSGSGSFLSSSNGLASGNSLLEAISHGICEVIERDACTLDELVGGARRRIDLDAVDDADCTGVLRRFWDAGIEVEVFDVTSDIAVPTFSCTITDPLRHSVLYHKRAGGQGSHLNAATALLRAVTEAAQSRLTMIAGSRDDMLLDVYQKSADPDSAVAADRRRAEIPRAFRSIESLSTETLRDDVLRLLELLRAAGLHHVIVVDLSRPEYPVSVVRVVIPGLESSLDMTLYQPGRRAMAAIERHAA